MIEFCNISLGPYLLLPQCLSKSCSGLESKVAGKLMIVPLLSRHTYSNAQLSTFAILWCITSFQEDNGNDLYSQAQHCQNPKFKKILYILARRESGACLWEKYPNDKNLVEVKVAATDPKWRRKGIMNALLKETE